MAGTTVAPVVPAHTHIKSLAMDGDIGESTCAGNHRSYETFFKLIPYYFIMLTTIVTTAYALAVAARHKNTSLRDTAALDAAGDRL
jgi:hypothetical protein